MEHDVADEIPHHKGETADESLCPGEVTATRSTTHREPDVLVADAAITTNNESMNE